MNTKAKNFRNYSDSPKSRGLGTVEGFLFVIGLCVAYHFGANWLADWSGAKWTEDRLQALATQTVQTAKLAQRAGLEVVDDSSLEATLQRLGAGQMAREGRLAGQSFVVKDLADTKAREKLAAYLKVEHGRLALMTDADRQVRGIN